MMGISALIRRDFKKLTFSLCHVRAKQGLVYKPGRELSPGIKLVSTLILDFPGLQNCEQINFWCLSHQSMVFCYGQQYWLMISVNLQEGSSGLPKGSLFSMKVQEKTKTHEQLNKSIAGENLGRMVKLRRQNKGLKILIRNLKGKSKLLQFLNPRDQIQKER